MISIVNPSSSFSVAASINDVPVTLLFLLDTGSALIILRKSIWDRCKQPDDKLEPWNQESLVGAEGTTLMDQLVYSGKLMVRSFHMLLLLLTL